MDRGAIFRVWVPLAFGLFALVVVFRRGPGPHDGVRWIGLILGLIGLAGVVTARYTLGNSFSVAARARALVTTGIYSRIRNPIYVSGCVLFAGVLLMVRTRWAWLILVPIVVMQTIRARREA